MRFYVYEISHEGQSVYIGKGCGNRLSAQMAAFRLPGAVVSWFRRERDAYAFEVKAIAERAPWMNVRKGGNGKRAMPKAARRKTIGEKLMERIGTRAYAARLCLKYWWLCDPSKLDALRQIAHHG